VTRVGASYVIVTKAEEFLDPDVEAIRAPHPWGPWTASALFRAPSTAQTPRYSPCVVAPDGSRSAVVVVSRTATSLPLLHREAWRSRPTFTDVILPG